MNQYIKYKIKKMIEMPTEKQMELKDELNTALRGYLSQCKTMGDIEI